MPTTDGEPLIWGEGMRRKKHEQEEPASGDRRVTPVDVQQVEFRLAFRGYNERDVDAFLDRITEDLSSYFEEIERLRAGAAAAPIAGRSDVDEIVARARKEAAETLRRAEDEAAAIRAVAGAAGAVGAAGAGDTRTALAPFLNREREFLQSLGTLVQGHAEEIKQMVLVLRAHARAGGESTSSEQLATADTGSAQAAPTAATEPATPAAAPERRDAVPEPIERDARPSPFATEPGSSEVVPASASEIADRLGMPAPAQDDPKERDERDPIVVESATEPAFSSEAAPAGERRERSLRELFWGED